VIVTSLKEVAIGSTAKVELITGSDPTSERLLEMGITPGVLVTVIGAAPLGCPLELEVRGYRLSIRRSDAARVAVFPSVGLRSTWAGDTSVRRPLPR
jgi:ferrous iron transport protein A